MSDNPLIPTHYLSVTEVSSLLNDTLEAAFPQIPFQGEISQISRPSSGHLYFTIKDPLSDKGNQISCVMWRSAVRNLGFAVTEGMAVCCLGRPSVYVVSGRLQITVSSMLLAGDGLLQQRFELLKKKLTDEGLFDSSRKRSLPFLPKEIGVVTSASGAVIHDIMVKIRERCPQLIVNLVDVRVQGEGAAAEIAAGVTLLSQMQNIKVIIVARGGGSLQDLWAFNEEEVVRAIFASRVPVISGVGHEVDTTLSDLVADVRAPTPTAAAELVVPRVSDLLASISQCENRLRNTDRWFRPLEQRVDEIERRLQENMRSLISNTRLRLQAAESRVSSLHPLKIIAMLHERILGLGSKLHSAATRQVTVKERLLERMSERFERKSPRDRIQSAAEIIELQEQRIRRGCLRVVVQHREVLRGLSLRYASVSPQRVLERGFALISRNGELVRSVDRVAAGDTLQVRLEDGTVDSVVQSVHSKEKVMTHQ